MKIGKSIVEKLHEENEGRWIQQVQQTLGDTGREAAEDIVQEAWLRFLKGIERNGEESMGGGYMVSSMQSLVVNEIRRRNRERRVIGQPKEYDQDFFETVEGGEESPLKKSLREERKARVRDVVLSLRKEDQRRAILARYWAGIGYREIAGYMDITPNAANLTLLRGKKRLGRLLEDIKDAI